MEKGGNFSKVFLKEELKISSKIDTMEDYKNYIIRKWNNSKKKYDRIDKEMFQFFIFILSTYLFNLLTLKKSLFKAQILYIYWYKKNKVWKIKVF